jgi:cbb3-type cytochrome oxidase maturation protein
MSALYIALPVALLLALVGVAAFIWSVRSGQMDDLETPALRIFGEDDERRAPHGAENPTDDAG